LKKTIKSYENLLIEKAKDSVKEFDLLKSFFVSISNDITREQKDIYESTHDIAEDLNSFFKELQSTQKIRVALENEIVKLKNINNRLTKQLKEK
jgi:septal ring factor EnvC (AmiA/AmiB activator)